MTGLSADTQAGLDANRRGAANLQGLLGLQRQGLEDTISGKYLDPKSNPFFESISDFVRSQVIPAVDSRFGAAGAFGTPLHQIGIAEGISRELAPHLFNAYQQERGIQDRAIANAASIGRENATAIGDILREMSPIS